MKRHNVAPGCFFEPAEDEPINPVMGVNKSSISFGDAHYRRRSTIEDIPDNFEERMRKHDVKGLINKEKDVKMPSNFTVTVAYNKGGYQVIPQSDLK